MFERVVARQLMTFLGRNNLLPSQQSDFRPGHSTETAVLRVLSDDLAAVDFGDRCVRPHRPRSGRLTLSITL